MAQKKKIMLWLILIGFEIVVVLVTYFNGSADIYTGNLVLFILPFGENAAEQQVFFMILAVLLPYVAIFLGFGLSYVVVFIYLRFTKLSKRIEFVGFSRVINSDQISKRRYLIQLVFGLLLCMNVWIFILGSDYFDFWVVEKYKYLMYDDTGRLFNFPMVPWYWVPVFITTLVFAMCSAIIDSGAVTIKKLPEHQEFSDTERVGDKIFTVIKGYAGISVVIGFIGILQTPMGKEMSLVLYPLLAAIFLFPMIVAIDVLKDFGRRVVFKAVKSQYDPELISLSSVKKPIADRKEIYQ